MAKFDSFLSLDCDRVEGVGAQSKERKGSNFAAQRSGAIVRKPEGQNTYNLSYSHLATMLPQGLPVRPGHAWREGDVAEPLSRRQRRLAERINQQGVVVVADRAGGKVAVKDDPEVQNSIKKNLASVLA